MAVQKSFSDVSTVWLNEAKRFASDKVALVLAGNKCDLTSERKVSTADGKVRLFLCEIFY